MLRLMKNKKRNEFMEIQYVKAGTVTALALSTGAAVFAAASAATAVATIAYAILSVGVGAIAIASITACFDETSTSTENYFLNIKKHAIVTIPATFSVVSQAMIQALIEGVKEGVIKVVSRKIAGDDVTVRVRNY